MSHTIPMPPSQSVASWQAAPTPPALPQPPRPESFPCSPRHTSVRTQICVPLSHMPGGETGVTQLPPAQSWSLGQSGSVVHWLVRVAHVPHDEPIARLEEPLLHCEPVPHATP